MKIIIISKSVAALVFILLTLVVFTFSSASLLQEKNSLLISKCGVGTRKMGIDCRGGGRKAAIAEEIWFQSLKKKQSPPPPPVIKKKKQLKSTSLSFRTPPRF
ncbi:hypothetical protein POM88_041289 [Heracleum sosnowskyi]|uniref:Uncharacterized protein n=1 Tax=Heracleum sosnowskyi TaxID=360622 RepID=A0AAD8HGD0_9APIA|nr:hypothetical protein POM88_041289 [Heracleum sosnowskyi]